MAYIVTPRLGMQLADPLTIQPFETPVVNANFTKIDDAVAALQDSFAMPSGDLSITNQAAAAINNDGVVRDAVASLEFQVPATRRVTITLEATITAPGNAAGVLYLELNGTSAGQPRRIQSLASGQAVQFTMQRFAVARNGANTVKFRASTDAGSAGAITYNSVRLIVTGL